MATERDRLFARLLRDTATGNERAFSRLYDDSSPYLYAIALKLMRVTPAADDVLQDAFVQIWHRAGDYHAERGSALAWMSSIVRYRAIDVLRRNRRNTPLDEDSMQAATRNLERFHSGDDDHGLSADDDSPVASAIATEDSDYLQECISRLSGSQKQSVALAFFHGMTHRELSDCLALPLGTIKSRLRRSLQRLKECLSELGYTNEISSGTG